MFLRFSATHAHPESGLEAGILWAAYRLRERGDLTLAEEEELAATLARLEAALPTPTKFSRTRNVAHRNTHGLSWVKSTATDIVADLHKLA
ncbi:MAG TPA: hypothetical protein VFS23_00065, partial [Vicinamibacterales bacterium]|nr:hypothetical protein [Vicinamibacterales bacterium]